MFSDVLQGILRRIDIELLPSFENSALRVPGPAIARSFKLLRIFFMSSSVQFISHISVLCMIFALKGV